MTGEAGRTAATASDRPRLELRNASKAFGYVIALQDASLTAHAGEVLALVGDNGAGKSTLVKVLSGIHPMDSEELYIDGEPVAIGSPRDAQELGIRPSSRTWPSSRRSTSRPTSTWASRSSAARS